MRARVSLLALAAIVVAGTAAIAQQVLKVPSQYKTIQAAIDAANTSDTVLVDPGVYREYLTISKAIHVVSRDGPAVTTITAPGSSGRIVTLAGPSRATILEGFTVTGGSGMVGGGIFALGSPTIRGNVVVGNQGNDRAGGIYVGGDALVESNVICNNSAFPFNAPGYGMFIQAKDAIIAGNLVYDNNESIYGGDGIHVEESIGVVLTNNTVVGNAAVGVRILSSSVVLSNNILWDNGVGSPKLQLHIGIGVNSRPTSVALQYSTVEGGSAGIRIDSHPLIQFQYGPSVLNGPPDFADLQNRDLHLIHGFGVRDMGLASAPGIPATDFEGDPRIAEGGVDMGADEFFPHLYHTGNPAPGGNIRVKLTGAPYGMAYWGYSGGRLVPPASIPGLQGLLHLDPGRLVVIPIGKFPSAGMLMFPVSFPNNFPKISIPTQALMGLQLSNLEVVHVR